MRHLRYFVVALLFVSHSAASGTESPARTVESFYAWAIRPAPDDQDKGLAPARPFLGQELLLALETQRTYEKACARLVPADVKPHMLDQSPFFLWPDGATSLEATRTVAKGNVARVFARLAYDGLRWTDTVVLRRENDQWVILDIEWEGGESLTRRLAAFASYRCAQEHSRAQPHPTPGRGQPG